MTFRGIRSVNKQLGAEGINKAGHDPLAELNASLQRLSTDQLRVAHYYPIDVRYADFNSNQGTIRTDGNKHRITLNRPIKHEFPFLVKIRVEVRHPTTINQGIEIWPTTTPTNPNRYYVYSQAANAYICQMFDLPIDKQKQLVYRVTGTGFNIIQINVMGYWV